MIGNILLLGVIVMLFLVQDWIGAEKKKRELHDQPIERKLHIWGRITRTLIICSLIYVVIKIVT